MERKAKVTQETVNGACEKLHGEGQGVTVGAVIKLVGGSFSTVGEMVKAWKDAQAAQAAPLPEMPESITKAMHKAAAELWGTASALASETVERIQKEAGEALGKAKAELSEYAGEVSRLENEIETASKAAADIEKRLSVALDQAAKLQAENAVFSERFKDKAAQYDALKADFDKLQGELIAIAKQAQKTPN